MSGTPLEVLMELGGWSDLRMVMRYAHLSPGHVARFADGLRPVDDSNNGAILVKAEIKNAQTDS